MKESVWGYWLILLGIAVLTLMMLLQNYTTIHQEDYYLLKEVTQAALYDSIDYNYYNKYGQLKINREVFIEMFERRFANSVKGNKVYKTEFYEIYESPPKVSVRVSTSTGNFNISNDLTNLNVTNDIDVILEHSADNVITSEFYSSTYLSCKESDQDAMGYCQYMNSFALNDNYFKSKASKDWAAAYGIEPDPSKLKVVSIEYVGNMSTLEDFQKYKDNYFNTYNKNYYANDAREADSFVVQSEHLAKEIRNVTILTNEEEQFAYSLKYKCPNSPAPIPLQNGNVVTDSCIIGLKYQIKFKYIP